MIKKIFLSTTSLAFLLLFSLGFLNPIVVQGDEEWQLQGGRACIEHYPECDEPGFVNALGAVQSGDLRLTGLSIQEFRESLSSGFNLQGDDVNRLCINEAYLDIIPRRGYINPNAPDQNLPEFDGTNYPVACPTGWVVQRGPHNAVRFNLEIAERADEPWGCCPSNDYKFVNQFLDEHEGDSNIQQGVCCLRDNPVGEPYKAVLEPGDTDNWQGPGCYTQGDEIIYNAQPAGRNGIQAGDDDGDAVVLDEDYITSELNKPLSQVTDQDIYTLLEGQPIISGIYGLPNNLNTTIAKGVTELDDAAIPAVGITLGSEFGDFANNGVNTRAYFVEEDRIDQTGLTRSCPNRGCAVYDISNSDNFDANELGIDLGEFNPVGGGSNNNVIHVSGVFNDYAEDKNNIRCQGCYQKGDVIAQSDNQVLFCNPDNTGGNFVDPFNIIDNDINLTRAVYLSEEGAPRQVTLNCIEQGGILTAIGCIDPSPIGVLTGLIRIALGVVGGVALLQLILAGLAYQSGNEENIQKAQSRIFATIGGLAVLIFSVLILRIIGVNILDVIPEGLV